MTGLVVGVGGRVAVGDAAGNAVGDGTVVGVTVRVKVVSASKDAVGDCWGG
jgi:hypothetical protein